MSEAHSIMARPLFATPRLPAATGDLRAWLDGARRSCDMQVRQIALPQSREWVYDGGALRHLRGAFFRVVGATVHRNGERWTDSDQPLIDQAEVGILGFLVRTVDGSSEILIQAKPEPGNVGLVQAAPSVQATESNYRQRHGGKATPFLEYFRSPGDRSVLSDGLQSEQGTRFLGKYNRNMVVEVAPGADLGDGPAFRWFAVEQLLPLLLDDHQVNTDARSILASSPWGLFAPGGSPFRRRLGDGGVGEQLLRSFEATEDRCVSTSDRILQRLRRLGREAGFVTTVVDLAELSGWKIDDAGIGPLSGDAFAMRQFAVTSSDREIPHWDQPLITAGFVGEAALLCQERGGILHFLFDARPEIGFRERYQYGPTIQDVGEKLQRCFGRERQVEALRDAASRSQVLCGIRNSDEGGRFFRCRMRYRVCLLDPGEPIDPGENLAWMTLGQIGRLVRRPGVFSNEARSLISMLLAFL